MAAKATQVLTPKRFADARNSQGLTQEALAREVGCSVVMIGKIEQGKRRPSDVMLRRIAKATAKPVSWFYSENGHSA